jgi:2-amino-4-hydroxy-6-hydroxymethyldihydropteridine diphosphokinase
MVKHETYLLLGSNLGDRVAELDKARILIEENIGSVRQQSEIYETDPWGNKEQPCFLNQVLVVQTNQDPQALLNTILSIEKLMGRFRTDKFGPRIIDIDILFYDELVIQSDTLCIPHPLLHERRFTLLPLQEINPLKKHPLFNQTIEALLLKCSDRLNVEKFTPVFHNH